MKKDEELALFSMVRSEVETGFRETDAIIDLMKVKMISTMNGIKQRSTAFSSSFCARPILVLSIPLTT
ncbi:hypothetical protein [Dickeya phage Coodle]|uniref:Uncharacterized protein n=3 Tax=Limestonevirus limestone TaxID=1091052 RepID=A0A7L4YJ78_9CAUD|nr:hypothetical protein [Dickeya phage XF4]AYN55482.1 hypothetical protein [Dickeya phage Coodle]QHB42614.1 hypothetical protein [Dickeya phage Ds25CZ]